MVDRSAELRRKFGCDFVLVKGLYHELDLRTPVSLFLATEVASELRRPREWHQFDYDGMQLVVWREGSTFERMVSEVASAIEHEAKAGRVTVHLASLIRVII